MTAHQNDCRSKCLEMEMTAGKMTTDKMTMDKMIVDKSDCRPK